MKVLGIPTKIEPSFFVLAFFLATGRGSSPALIVEWLLVVFVSVLLHELGHALVARKFGVSPSITLCAMGGLTSWQSHPELTPLRHLLISLAGPAAGFLFGGIVFLVGPRVLDSEGFLASVYFDLLWVNVGWGIFNLLPMLPLDGGQVLLTLEEWLLGNKSQVISNSISLLVALGIVCLAVFYRLIWIAFLGAWFAYSSGGFLFKKLRTHRDQNLFGEASYLKGLFFFQQEEMSAAIPHLKTAFEQSPDKEIGLVLSKALTTESKFAELLELIKHPALEEVKGQLSVNLQIDSFNGADFGISGQAGAIAYDLNPDPNVAYNTACAFARAGDATEALHWLERAVETGFSNKQLIGTDSDLESLRASPSFGSILANMADVVRKPRNQC